MFGTWTYLVFELGWSCPVLFLQWTVGWKTLLSRRRSLLGAVLLATLYLSCTDSIAIASGIWTLHRNRIVGAYIGNVPLEEVIFFLVTNVMVVQSVLLVYRPAPGTLWSRVTSRLR